MTTLQTVAVRDSAIGYNRPFFTPSLGLAIRSFTDEVNRSAADNPMHAHPDAFELYHLGTFDDETAYISILPVPKLLATATNVKTNT